MRMAVGAGGALGLDGTQTFWALLLVGATVATLLGRLVLKWLGRRHVARRSSDQLLTLEAMWLLFAVVQSVGFAFEGLAWLAAGPLAFLAWKLTTVAGQVNNRVQVYPAALFIFTGLVYYLLCTLLELGVKRWQRRHLLPTN